MCPSPSASWSFAFSITDSSRLSSSRVSSSLFGIALGSIGGRMSNLCHFEAQSVDDYVTVACTNRMLMLTFNPSSLHGSLPWASNASINSFLLTIVARANSRLLSNTTRSRLQFSGAFSLRSGTSWHRSQYQALIRLRRLVSELVWLALRCSSERTGFLSNVEFSRVDGVDDMTNSPTEAFCALAADCMISASEIGGSFGEAIR